MGWQEDLARTNDPWLRRPATTSKKSSSEKRAERKKRNIYNETIRRAQSGDTSDYVKRQLADEYGLNLRTAQDAPYRASVTPQWQKNLGKEVRKFGSTVGTMGKDLGTAAYSPFKPVFSFGADFLGKGLGSFMESEKARVGGKFNAPLNVQYGTPAYKWLLEDVIKDEDDQDDFRREVAKGNLSWTELNKYADDEYIGGGQLARGINARNEGIIGSGAGAEALADAYRAQADEIGDGAIGNALANYNLKINSMNLPDTMSDENKMYYAANPEKYYASHPFSMRTGQKAPVIYSDLMATADPWVATQQAAMAGMEPFADEDLDFPMDDITNAPKGSFFTDEEGDRYISTGTGGLSFDPGNQSFWEDETGTWQLEPKLEHPWSRSSRFSPPGVDYYKYP